MDIPCTPLVSHGAHEHARVYASSIFTGSQSLLLILPVLSSLSACTWEHVNVNFESYGTAHSKNLLVCSLILRQAACTYLISLRYADEMAHTPI